MTWFYKCRGCDRILGFGSSGKGLIMIVKVYGECCYDYKEEAKEINEWRVKTGKDVMDFGDTSAHEGEKSK